MRADRLIVINRVKQHTDFEAHYESGLLKMLAIGVGKREGAMAMHSRLCHSLCEDMPEAARPAPCAGSTSRPGSRCSRTDITKPPRSWASLPAEIPAREVELLKQVRRIAARLPFSYLDLVLVDRMGKDISGIGMDTHVRGPPHAVGSARTSRARSWRIRLVAALDLTDASHGNPLGIGLADLMTESSPAKSAWTP